MYQISFTVSAKYCSVPPDPPSGGSVTVTSDGYMFGHDCSTAGYETVPGNGGCDTELNLERSEVVGTFREEFKILLWLMTLILQGAFWM